jgi:hypothetical protein
MIVTKEDIEGNSRLRTEMSGVLSGLMSSGLDDLRYREGKTPKGSVAEWASRWRDVSFSSATADQLFAAYREGNLTRSIFKGVRPWSHVDFVARYPEAPLLIGVEVEAGFKNTTQHGKAYSYLMDECEYCTADMEGYDEFPLEATFPPIPADQLLEPGCQLLGYYDNVMGKQPELWDNSDMIGTHFNVSWPALHRGSVVVAARVNEVTRAIEDMRGSADSYCCEDCDGDYDDWAERDRSGEPDNCVYKLFGRRPYGYLYPQSTTVNGQPRRWIEMKLFNSTTDILKLRWYKEVTVAIATYIRDGGYGGIEAVFAQLEQRSPLTATGDMPVVQEARRAGAR